MVGGRGGLAVHANYKFLAKKVGGKFSHFKRFERTFFLSPITQYGKKYMPSPHKSNSLHIPTKTSFLSLFPYTTLSPPLPHEPNTLVFRN